MPKDRILRLLGYAAAITIATLFVSYLMDRQKSFAVSAVTEYLRVETTSEGADDWSLVAAHICMPKPPATMDETPPPQISVDHTTRLSPEEIGISADCNPQYFDQKTYSHRQEEEEELTLRWTKDYALDIRDFDRNFLYIYITRASSKKPEPTFFDGHEIPNDSILYIPLNDQEPIRLALRGYMTLGEPPVRSDAMILREGKYEIREDGWRSRSHVVASGSFFPGDRVSFEREPKPFWQFWKRYEQEEEASKIISRIFVSDLVADEPGFDVVATTDPKFSGIYLTRVGGQPTRIPVSWAKKITSDPLIAAVATILGLLATLLALRNNFFPVRSRAPEDEKS